MARLWNPKMLNVILENVIKAIGGAYELGRPLFMFTFVIF